MGGWASECAHTQAVRKEGGRSPAGSPRGAALRLGPAGARLGSARLGWAQLGSAELQRGSEAGESQALPQDEEQGPSGSLFSCTTAFCHRVLIYFFSNTKITKTHDLPCLCLPTPGCILQGVFDSVFNHSPGGASRPVRWPGGGGGGGGSVGGEERELGGRAPAGAEVARGSPAPPHELIPGSAPRDDIMVSPPAHSGRAPAVPEQGKISIGISSCSRGTGILCKGVVACILSAPA